MVEAAAEAEAAESSKRIGGEPHSACLSRSLSSIQRLSGPILVAVLMPCLPPQPRPRPSFATFDVALSPSYDSFVVRDDEDIVYASSSSPAMKLTPRRPTKKQKRKAAAVDVDDDEATMAEATAAAKRKKKLKSKR